MSLTPWAIAELISISTRFVVGLGVFKYIFKFDQTHISWMRDILEFMIISIPPLDPPSKIMMESDKE